MSKKLNLAVMIVVVFAMLLSACQAAATAAPAAEATTAPAAATPAAASGEKVELVYWSMWNEGENQAKAIAETISAFEAKNPNIHITVTWNGRENQTLLRNALASGTKVDLMDQDADQVAGGMVAAGQGYALNDLLESKALDEDVPFKDVFTSGTLHMFDVDGKTYLVPYIYNTAQIFYSKAAFEKAGVTDVKTWDDLLTACGKLSKAGYAPMAIEGPEPGYNAFVFTYIMERLKGPGFLTKAANDKTGETWKDPAVLQAAKMSRELWEKGCVPEKSAGYKWPEAQNMLASGETAMELVGAWLPTELLSATGPDFQWGALAFPEISGGAGKNTDLEGLLLSYMILKDSAHPTQAFEFLKFMLTKEQQQKMVTAGAVGVVRKGVEWPANLKEAQTAAESATAVFGEGDGLQGSNAELWVKVIRDPFSNMFIGQATPEEFVAKLSTDTVAYWADK
jgi:raffinose/stachyose/melibiose transport system substrate-binding protein